MCFECGCGRPGGAKIDGKPAASVGLPANDELQFKAVDMQLRLAPFSPGFVAQEHRPREMEVHEALFAANDRMAARNRDFFSSLKLFVINVISSPGSGKTTLLSATIKQLGGALLTGVIVGDLETDNDAMRLRRTGVPVVQITTGTLCHLDAEMVARAAGCIQPETLDLLFVENVGNLVCPADFDLGENRRVALLSTTEGEDKPLKYPPLFRFADVVVVTKSDLAPHVDFDREAALAAIRRVNPKARIFEVSAKSGDGMEEWCSYLQEACAECSGL